MKRLVLALSLLALCTNARSAETWAGRSDVKFKGYSTLHDFEGSLSGVPLKVTVNDGANGRVVSATSDAEVKRMSTRNDDRDKNMWNMFNAAKYPFVKISVSQAEERTLRPKGGAPGSMRVTLSAAGNSTTVNARVSKLVEGPNALSFDLAFGVSLAALKLDPPKTMAGLIKVQDNVDVSAHVTLKKQAE